MGIGDEIIASGHALTESLRLQRRVRIVDKMERPRWDEMWEGLRYIVRPTEHGDYPTVQNGGKCRPYIRYPFTRESGCTYSGWRVRDNIGRIALTRPELEFARDATAGLGPFIIVEPNLTAKTNPNKQWGWDRWQQLVKLLPYTAIQVGKPGTPTLDGVRLITTPTFRMAAAVLARSASAILPEGGLHHASGALGKYVMVLFGGSVDENAMGYPWHCNIADRSEGSPCGRWTECTHCARVWGMLSAETVADRFNRYLVETKQKAVLNARAS